MTISSIDRARRIVEEHRDGPRQALIEAIAVDLSYVQLAATPHTRDIASGPTDEECAVACVLVSNPQGALRADGDGWQRRVNDVIRALRDERNALRAAVNIHKQADEGR